MLYRVFAVATLIVAPLIVLMVQQLVPSTNHDVAPVNAGRASTTPQMAPAPTTDGMTAVGTATTGADQPMLAPGSGLPVADSATPLSEAGSSEPAIVQPPQNY